MDASRFLKLSSGDLKVFRFVGEMTAEALTVEMPDEGIALVGFNGRIPLVEDLAINNSMASDLPGPSKICTPGNNFLTSSLS